jgi:hypothetical protein
VTNGVPLRQREGRLASQSNLASELRDRQLICDELQKRPHRRHPSAT